MSTGYTPVVGDFIFRIELGPQGKEVLIDPLGHAVVGVSTAGLELTPGPVADTQRESLKPHAKLPLLENTGRQLAEAMSKDAFLTSIQELLKALPLKGEFRTAPAKDRIWNRWTTEREMAPRPEPIDSAKDMNKP